MNCTCKAYLFPHRPASGRCDGNELWSSTYRDGEQCGECQHFRHMSQKHPYGEGWAVEHWHECVARHPSDCPVVADAAARGGRVAA